MSRVILHSDCNSFYASVECLHRPQIRNKPVAVCGDISERHGIVLAKNEIAKKAGVKTGEAIWQAKQKCPDLVTVLPDFKLYSRFSKMAKAIYLEYTDKVESFGLDEAWLDVTDSAGIYGSGLKIAQEIGSRIKQELGITVSIGVSFNKIFAKLGSDYKKPDAITEISVDNYKEIVWALPCSCLLYVGNATAKKLRAMGIFTIGDIARTPVKILNKNLGKWGEMLYCFANGYEAAPVSKYGEESDIKSIGNSTTCPRDLKNIDDVKIVLQVLTDSVARRLRENGLYCKCVGISVRSNDLESFTRQHTLQINTNLTNEIYDTALMLFENNYDFSRPIRSIGISLSMLGNTEGDYRFSLFDDTEKRSRMEKLDKTLDEIKNRFGTKGIFCASAMLDNELSGFDPKVEHIIHPVGYF